MSWQAGCRRFTSCTGRASSVWAQPCWRPSRSRFGNQYDYLLNLDADFSHPPRFIPALLEGMRDHDVMIGSRYVPGGGVEGGFNLKRKFMSSGINWYARIIAGPLKQGQQRGLSLLPRQQARPDRPEQGPLAGIFVSGRDPLLVQARGLPDRRDAHPV